MNNLLKTSLHQTHINSNAKLVPFAGWEMPIQYSSILSECKAVRSQSGIFDVSHMGRFYISGNDASLALDKILSVNPFIIEKGQGKYNVICNQNGGIIDDAIVYKINDNVVSFFLSCGSFASMFLRELMKAHYPLASGF